MKRLLAALILVLLAAPVNAQDIDKAGPKTTLFENLSIIIGAQAYENGDYETALREIRPLAQQPQGNSAAQYLLGLMYHHGNGVPQDHAEAARWYRRAAEQGQGAAMANLGTLHETGMGVPQDYAKAIKLYLVPAQNGWAEAQANLGSLLSKGKGVPQDYEMAVRWYREAAEQGLPRAQALLGGMYIHGHGVAQDYVLAHMWANLAAAKGLKLATELRDNVAEQMNPAQIAEAQRMAREWLEAHPQ